MVCHLQERGHFGGHTSEQKQQKLNKVRHYIVLGWHLFFSLQHSYTFRVNSSWPTSEIWCNTSAKTFPSTSELIKTARELLGQDEIGIFFFPLSCWFRFHYSMVTWKSVSSFALFTFMLLTPNVLSQNQSTNLTYDSVTIQDSLF